MDCLPACLAMSVYVLAVLAFAPVAKHVGRKALAIEFEALGVPAMALLGCAFRGQEPEGELSAGYFRHGGVDSGEMRAGSDGPGAGGARSHGIDLIRLPNGWGSERCKVMGIGRMIVAGDREG